jgi:hypothetical protein
VDPVDASASLKKPPYVTLTIVAVLIAAAAWVFSYSDEGQSLVDARRKCSEAKKTFEHVIDGELHGRRLGIDTVDTSSAVFVQAHWCTDKAMAVSHERSMACLKMVNAYESALHAAIADSMSGETGHTLALSDRDEARKFADDCLG